MRMIVVVVYKFSKELKRKM